jgi:hypothetical protein
MQSKYVNDMYKWLVICSNLNVHLVALAGAARSAAGTGPSLTPPCAWPAGRVGRPGLLAPAGLAGRLAQPDQPPLTAPVCFVGPGHPAGNWSHGCRRLVVQTRGRAEECGPGAQEWLPESLWCRRSVVRTRGSALWQRWCRKFHRGLIGPCSVRAARGGAWWARWGGGQPARRGGAGRERLAARRRGRLGAASAKLATPGPLGGGAGGLG